MSPDAQRKDEVRQVELEWPFGIAVSRLGFSIASLKMEEGARLLLPSLLLALLFRGFNNSSPTLLPRWPQAAFLDSSGYLAIHGENGKDHALDGVALMFICSVHSDNSK
ncbi:hypothetical protein MTO96_023287 [Rhipicephalus appendiculatus]